MRRRKTRLQKRPRVGLERGRLHLLKVDERSGVFQLAVLVEPPEDVLAETRALACGARGQVTQHPLVVEPDIRAVHAQVEHVVQILAAGDPRVKGEAPERLLVDGQAAAAHMVRARQARAAHGLGDPLVEGAALLPEAVVPLVLPFREVGVLVVQIVPRLRHDGHALARELPEAVHGLFQEFRVVDHLVVVQEHHGVEAEHVGHEQAQIADGAVALKADLFGEALDVLPGPCAAR